MIKLYHDRSCPWVKIAQVTKAPPIITKVIPTRTYHFEDNMRNLYGDRLYTRYTTNTLGCGGTTLLGLPQQISIILGNPPLSLLTKLHKAWTETTLHETLPYISFLEALLYT